MRMLLMAAAIALGAGAAIAQTGSSGSSGATAPSARSGSSPSATGAPSTVGPATSARPGTGDGRTIPGENLERFPPSRLLAPDARTPSEITGDRQMPPPAGATDSSATARGGAASKPQGSDMSVAECEGTWDPSTHMGKEQWAESCRRVEKRDEMIRQR